MVEGWTIYIFTQADNSHGSKAFSCPLYVTAPYKLSYYYYYYYCYYYYYYYYLVPLAASVCVSHNSKTSAQPLVIFTIIGSVLTLTFQKHFTYKIQITLSQDGKPDKVWIEFAIVWSHCTVNQWSSLKNFEIIYYYTNLTYTNTRDLYVRLFSNKIHNTFE